MSDGNSMVATRARRANAGSRLKQLIEIEEQSTEQRTMVYANDDDENVQLLFQEDENDEEFEESNEEESGEESSREEDTDDVAGQLIQPADNTDETLDIETHVNSDEMLSDSEISASDDDESEGERELQKQEKSKKRKKALASIIPAIKKPKVAKPKPSAKPEVKHLELLLLGERRASSRKSAIRNKEELVQRLKEDESRRATLIPVVRIKEKELTQEERLEEAKETERANIASLNLFMEQEIVKKERQKLLFQQRRLQLRNVIRLYSTESYVTPLDEVENDRHIREVFEKKRRGRRRKNILEEPETRRLGDIDTELPYYKREMEIKRIKELEEEEKRKQSEAARAEKRRKLEEEREERKRKLEDERLARKKAKEERLKEFEDVDIDTDRKLLEERTASLVGGDRDAADKIEEDINDHQSEEDINDHRSEEDIEKKNEKDVGENEESEEDNQKEQPDIELPPTPTEKYLESKISTENTPEEVGDHDELQCSENLKTSSPSVTKEVSETQTEISENGNIEGFEIKSETYIDAGVREDIKLATVLEIKPEDAEERKEKKVTFADLEGDLNIDEQPDGEKEEKDTEEKAAEVSEGRLKLEEELDDAQTFRSYPTYVPDKDGRIFQGPVQHVARNLIFLLDFDEEERWGLSEMKMKSILFGEDANLGPSRRFRDVETILRSSLRSDNPYATPKEEKEDELLIPVTELTEESTMFDILSKLPRLGTKEIFEEEEIDESKEETTEIRIRTEAPTGLYLPNGNKKLCLISGREVRYFDPVTGIPYENKEVYQIIKTIELGAIPWYSLGKDQNTYGPVEIFLNNRENPRHAKGVPEGFDGV